jgi:activator of HSP90 ATPase
MRFCRQSHATADPRVGGAFSLYGGSVTGTYRELEKPRRLVQEWRFSNWVDGMVSKVWKPIGYTWSYLECRIGHLVPLAGTHRML